jgi:class 3 adenylate cyclase
MAHAHFDPGSTDHQSPDHIEEDARTAFRALHIAAEQGDERALDRADAMIADDRITPEETALAYADVALCFADGQGVARDAEKMNEYVFLALKVGVFDVLLSHPISARMNLRELFDVPFFT